MGGGGDILLKLKNRRTQMARHTECINIITQAQSAAKTQDATDAILEMQKSFEAMKARMEHMEKGIIQHCSEYV